MTPELPGHKVIFVRCSIVAVLGTATVLTKILFKSAHERIAISIYSIEAFLVVPCARAVSCDLV
jgi:predicted membrane channel-forming protein YqfA (hemolysin III family)